MSIATRARVTRDNGRPIAPYEIGRIQLRNRETATVTSHFPVDAREIMNAESCIYEPADDVAREFVKKLRKESTDADAA